MRSVPRGRDGAVKIISEVEAFLCVQGRACSDPNLASTYEAGERRSFRCSPSSGPLSRILTPCVRPLTFRFCTRTLSSSVSDS